MRTHKMMGLSSRVNIIKNCPHWLLLLQTALRLNVSNMCQTGAFANREGSQARAIRHRCTFDAQEIYFLFYSRFDER